MRFWASILLILVIDQLSKFWVVSSMVLGESRPIIEGILDLTYVRNRGAAFSILQGQYWFFIIMALAVVLVLTIYNLKYSPVPWLQYATGLIVAGSLGNVIDRWFYGSVRDFLSIGWWPVFNVADMAIVSGGTLVMLYIFLNDTTQELKS
ncbi:MAG: signal peptidase II [Firmicutes bacterium HGW-Firmicutes-15]|nr:MAG: signal peptidase II [Firmicutes bacterium HGW-Firmicutes-15]